MLTLPIEILCLIATHLRLADVERLCGTCRLLYSWKEVLLEYAKDITMYTFANLFKVKDINTEKVRLDLSGTGMRKLPLYKGRFKELNLSINPIRSLPDTIRAEHLDLSYTLMQELPLLDGVKSLNVLGSPIFNSITKLTSTSLKHLVAPSITLNCMDSVSESFPRLRSLDIVYESTIHKPFILPTTLTRLSIYRYRASTQRCFDIRQFFPYLFDGSLLYLTELFIDAPLLGEAITNTQLTKLESVDMRWSIVPSICFGTLMIPPSLRVFKGHEYKVDLLQATNLEHLACASIVNMGKRLSLQSLDIVELKAEHAELFPCVERLTVRRNSYIRYGCTFQHLTKLTLYLHKSVDIKTPLQLKEFNAIRCSTVFDAPISPKMNLSRSGIRLLLRKYPPSAFKKVEFVNLSESDADTLIPFYNARVINARSTPVMRMPRFRRLFAIDVSRTPVKNLGPLQGVPIVIAQDIDARDLLPLGNASIIDIRTNNEYMAKVRTLPILRKRVYAVGMRHRLYIRDVWKLASSKERNRMHELIQDTPAHALGSVSSREVIGAGNIIMTLGGYRELEDEFLVEKSKISHVTFNREIARCLYLFHAIGEKSTS